MIFNYFDGGFYLNLDKRTERKEAFEIRSKEAGIEVELTSIRGNRVQDYTVQLVLNGVLVGDNIADPSTDNIKIYGSSTNLWNSSIAITDVSNATFGVVIAFRSNVTIPHSDLGYLDQLRMRITYG